MGLPEEVCLHMAVKESRSEPGEPFQTDLENRPLAIAFEFQHSRLISQQEWVSIADKLEAEYHI